MVVLTSVVALAQMGLTSVYDYRSQVQQLTLMHHIHNGAGTTIRLDPGVSVPAEAPACTGLCSQKQGTLDAHVRGLRLGLLLLLVTNGVLVLWALALRGGRIWIRRGPATTVRPSTTTTPRPPMDATPSFGGESTLEAVPHVR